MGNSQRISGLLLAAFLIILFGGCSYPLLVTSQYVDKPVVIGPYWKVNGKIDDYVNLKKQKSDREFETEVERMVSSSTQQHGNYQTTTTQTLSVHSDNISKEILMQNPKDDELIMIKECYIGAYFMAAPGGSIMKTFGGVDGMVIPKPAKSGK